jgi:dipeptidyl aminopeptidase/acylaminoacyl peptidase
MSFRGRAAWAITVTAILLTACNDPDRSSRAGPPSPAVTSANPASSPAPAASPAQEANPVSLPALMNKQFSGSDLKLGEVQARNDAYTRYFVTYKSGDLTISGIMNVPNGNGPFPALVLAHGYIDPDGYTNGQGLRREQDYLARRGYIVLHTDYRNHARSDKDPDAEMKLRLGYIEDVINASLALQNSGLPSINRERIGLLGRSMGGGVTFGALVVKPDLFDAAVVFAPVSSDYIDNFNRWIRGDRGIDRRQLAERVIATYGSPEANPSFWRNISPVNFFDRISVPLIMHHGTNDESVPIDWSHKTLAALKTHRKNVELFIYEGEHHAFGPQWPTSMGRTLTFFDRHLKG